MTVSRAMKAHAEQGLIAHGVHAGQQFILKCLWQEDGLTPGEGRLTRCAIALALTLPVLTLLGTLQSSALGGPLRSGS